MLSLQQPVFSCCRGAYLFLLLRQVPGFLHSHGPGRRQNGVPAVRSALHQAPVAGSGLTVPGMKDLAH